MFRLHTCLMGGLLWAATCAFANGQSARQRADLAYGGSAYAQAIPLYEHELVTENLSVTDRQAMLLRLGYSYHQTHDSKQAERVYRQLVTEAPELPADQYGVWLYYAQALAANGKFRESADAFDRYERLKEQQQQQALAPALGYLPVLAKDVSALSNDRSEYKIDFLPINTTKAEFSPTYYKNGLVYVSANGSRGRGFLGLNKSQFLDLRFLPDLSTLNARAGQKVMYQGSTHPLGSDFYSPATPNDGPTKSFAAGRQLSAGEGYGRVPVSESARFDKSLNSRYHEGPATFTHDGTRVYFTRNNYLNGKAGQSSNGVNKLKLYTAVQQNGTWQHVEELPFNSNEYSVGHPALGRSSTGEPDQLLYFSSDMPGGFGGTDIYVCRRVNSGWGQPINLGSTVNSKGNELFPYADDKGNLYFASDGLPGKGGLDIFYASLTPAGDDVNWVRNLGEPINSPADDFGIVTDGIRQAGYFSSNRKHGGADDDLYHFARKGDLFACRELVVRVYEAGTNAPLSEVSLTVTRRDDPSNPENLRTDATGAVRFCIQPDNDFLVSATQTGFVPNQAGLSTKNLIDRQPMQLSLPLSRPAPTTQLSVSRLDVASPVPPTTPKPTLTTKPTLTKPTGTTVIDNPAADSNPASDAGMSIISGHVRAQKTGKPVAGAIVILRIDCDGTRIKTATDADGAYSFPVRPGCTDYTLSSRKWGYASLSSRVRPDSSRAGELLMFRTGDIVTLENVLYDVNRFDIRPDAAAELDRVVTLLRDYPTMKIELRSHTDSRATGPYNKTLSENRAKAAAAYLHQQGIAKTRIKAVGYGETLPLIDCPDDVPCSEEDYQRNRRTEIRVLAL